MANVVEDIPDSLRAEAEAAVAWLNAERGADFHLTGLVDPEEAARRREDGGTGPVELGLILCQDEACVRERVSVQPLGGDRYEFAAIEASGGAVDPPPLEDPPSGVRAGWLDEQLSRHAFVVLVFYRGFW